MSAADFDLIVVGSGASGVHAAYRPARAGLRVLMLDVGNDDESYRDLIPDASFASVRRTDHAQHRYFLGDNFEGIPLHKVESGAQVPPPRAFVFKDAATLAPTIAPDFSAMQSFASGGLGQAWGAVSFPFLDRELMACGLNPASMREHYEAIAERVGVSGDANDDLTPLRGALQALQPALLRDQNAAALQARYLARRDALQACGISLGSSMLSALSQGSAERRALSCFDMDYFVNAGDSVYRPQITLRQLRSLPNFVYRKRLLVQQFTESDANKVCVSALNLESRALEQFSGRALALAAGSLGTTRLVLRSLNQYETAVPFVCNPHSFIPSIRLAGLGSAPQDRQHSLAQLTMIHDPGAGAELVQAQMYSYRSLMLFRLLNDLPLAYRYSTRVLRALLPAFVIWVVQHADLPGPAKTCKLRRNSQGIEDFLEISYRLTADETHRNELGERAIARAIRKLGCWPLKIVRAVHGSSIHYGGQFPITDEQRPLTTRSDGRLRDCNAVYIADGSSFARLPAKGPTLTLMANADRIGRILIERLKN